MVSSGVNDLIGRYEHLNTRPHNEKAKELLLKTGSFVKPIMKNHGWKVGTLCEFVPSNPNLLGMNQNAGQKILLRLRPHSAQDTFYDQEQIVLVMLHELTHNVFGPHDAKFYKLLGELEEEYYELKRKGYSGEGFLSSGSRLGGSLNTVGIPQHIGKIKGLEAAEKRAAKQKSMGRGGVLGGGGVSRVGKSMREVLLEATERRLKDDKSCSHTNTTTSQIDEEVRKAAAESTGQDAKEAEKDTPQVIDVIDLLDSDEEGDDGTEEVAAPVPALVDVVREGSGSGPVGGAASGPRNTASAGSSKPAGQAVATTSASIPASLASTSQAPTKKPSLAANPSKPAPTPSSTTRAAPAPSASSTTTTNNDKNIWSCPTCTLHNPLTSKNCEVCGNARPPPPGYWQCDICATENEEVFWSCQGCGKMVYR